MNKRNYQAELDMILKDIDKEKTPKLLLHSCCAPCSSYVLEYLSNYFEITVLYYNPNIYPEEEFYLRLEEQKNFIEKFPAKNKISFIPCEHRADEFYSAVKGYEKCAEGYERCEICFNLRLSETAKIASEQNFDYFTTTLSISPHKNANMLMNVSEKLSQIYSVKNLPSDFKKKGGFLRSTELSRQYNIYRQDYCGCVFSKSQREESKNTKEDL